MKFNLLVYGTLRPGRKSFRIPGKMFQHGWFPAVTLIDPDEDDSTIAVERIGVSLDVLHRLDRYEGYDVNSPKTSLFKRSRFNDNYIYIFNGETTNLMQIKGGDWLEHTGQKKGQNYGITT